MSKKAWIIYHGSDLDGLSSAAIAYRYLYEKQFEITSVPVDYGSEDNMDFGKVNGAEDLVIIVDFAFTGRMLNLSQTIKNLIWIDHHKSAIDEAERHGYENMVGLRSVDFAACELTWAYLRHLRRSETFIPQSNLKTHLIEDALADMPTVIRHLGRYDIWDHEDPDTLIVNYGCKSLDLRDVSINNINWGWIFNNSPGCLKAILDKGKVVASYEKQKCTALALGICYVKRWEGYTFLMANIAGVPSQFFEFHPKYRSVDGCLNYYFDYKNKNWILSLKNEPDNPVSLLPIAQKLGGGGHPHACGCTIDDITPLLK